MIPRALLLFFILSMSSCGSHPKPDTGSGSDSSISITAGKSALASSGADFKTLRTALDFAGAWVNEVYVDSIHKNQSPGKDQVIMESCIEIPDSTLKKTCMIGGFHDGGPAIVIVKKGNQYQFYDPELKIPGAIIEPISARRLRIGNQYFQKLEHPDMEKEEWGILNELLFSGNYQNEEGKEVIFEMNGHIRGLDTVTYYQPHADYTEEQDLDADRISMGRSPNKVHVYGFRFNKDTLSIYNIDCLKYDSAAHECGLEKLGSLIWKLHRMPG